MDSDNDGLNDGDEFTSIHSRRDKQETDGDGLTDWQEVVQFGGRFNPNDPDTDHDGTNDFVEAFPQGDADEDGLSNADESTKGTNPTQPDTDCDGARPGIGRGPPLCPGVARGEGRRRPIFLLGDVGIGKQGPCRPHSRNDAKSNSSAPGGEAETLGLVGALAVLCAAWRLRQPR